MYEDNFLQSLPWRSSQFLQRASFFAVKIHLGGPLRIAAWPIWSGRERSSHSHFLQVPQIRLASLFILCVPYYPNRHSR